MITSGNACNVNLDLINGIAAVGYRIIIFKNWHVKIQLNEIDSGGMASNVYNNVHEEAITPLDACLIGF